MLDDFLTTLVLEVDINIGWFITLNAEKPFEEHLDEFWIHFRDAERIADN
jgi:hypothetical protein